MKTAHSSLTIATGASPARATVFSAGSNLIAQLTIATGASPAGAGR